MDSCNHPPDQITADILQGDFPGHQVRWCRQCGAFRVRAFARNYLSPWNLPTFQIDPLCPTPELDGTVPVVLYFGTHQEADEFMALVLEAKPELKQRKL